LFSILIYYNEKVNEFIEILGGKFIYGSNNNYPEERPSKEVEVDSFLLSETTVTNAQFENFVNQTGYITVAEKTPDPIMYPNIDPNLLKPGAVVFKKTKKPVPLNNPGLWWSWVEGANWRHPLGPNSNIEKKMDHPVVQVAYQDAVAYASWAGGRLPTEKEWERAARGPYIGLDYPYPEGYKVDNKEVINRWLGQFPNQWNKTTGRPSVPGTVAVKTFPATEWGLYEICGNVWEWTSSFYVGDHSQTCCGPDTVNKSRNPQSGVPRKTLRGGSFLCAENYCRRFRVSARIPQDIESATCHIGFRVAKDL
jgi:sulfatase modifying factor 1